VTGPAELTATGQANHARAWPAPEAGGHTGGQPDSDVVRTLLIVAALTLPLVGIVAFLLAFQPFVGAAGGCGGG